MSEKQDVNFKDFSLENIFNGTFDEPIDDPQPDPIDPVEPEPVIEPEPIDDPIDDPVPDPIEPDPEPSDDNEEVLNFYKTFNEKFGIEGVEISEDILNSGMDGVFDYLNEVKNTMVEQEKEEILSMGDGLLGDLYQYLNDGGDPKTFVKTFLEAPDYTELDITGDDNVNNQKLVVKQLLEKMGDDPEDVEERIKNYDESGILEREAKLAQKKLIKLNEQDKVNLLKQQEQAKQDRIKAEETYWDNVKTSIKSAKDIAGIPLNDKQKEEFSKYLTVKDKQGLTQYQKDLQADKEIALKLAFASFSKFDFSKVKASAKSEVVKDVKKALSRFTDGNAQTQQRAKTIEEPKNQNKVDFKAFKIH